MDNQIFQGETKDNAIKEKKQRKESLLLKSMKSGSSVS